MSRSKTTIRKEIKGKRARISQEDIPAFSLNDAIRIPQAIVDNYGKAPTPAIRVAAALKMAPGGTQFKMLCGAAIAYGLTVGGYNAATISLTPLAKRILTPTLEGDDAKARLEAFLRPRIIKEFVFKYNQSPLPKDEIAVNVLEDLGVPRNRASVFLKIITDTASTLGLIQEIKGKAYLIADESALGASSVDEENSEGDANGEGIEVTNQPRITTLLPISVGATIERNNGNGSAETGRAKRVFITHGKNKAFVDPIRKLLQFGELEAIVAAERQSVSEPVPDKVMNDMRSCGAAIIHVEGELKLMDAEAKEHIVLNSNVLIEIGAAMALYGKRFILLVKEGVKLPSNLQGLYEVRYSGDTLDGNVTIKLLEAINELKKRPLVDRSPVSGVVTVSA